MGDLGLGFKIGAFSGVAYHALPERFACLSIILFAIGEALSRISLSPKNTESEHD